MAQYSKKMPINTIRIVPKILADFPDIVIFFSQNFYHSSTTSIKDRLKFLDAFHPIKL